MRDLGGTRVHFMGAGGIGMSALALMAHAKGARVSGCDRSPNAMTALLQERGIPFSLGHSPAHVVDADLLVYTSAVPESHPECLAAPAREKRGAFLARFLDAGPAYGVCGAHGKTSTSWLLSQILMTAGLDPSVFIGGEAAALAGRNHRIGSGPFVAELDESDGSFLLPRLDLALVTNVESDHLSHYGDETALFAAFRRFADGVAPDGVLVTNADDPASAGLFSAHDGRRVTFGLAPDAMAGASHIRPEKDGTVFSLRWEGESRELRIPMTGLHTIRNALAAAAAAFAVGVSLDTVASALEAATGVARRMEVLGTLGDAALYTDYAHHPTEVAAAIAAARQRHGGKLLAVFQPHLYTRTRDYADAFGLALARADTVLLADIYPAREEPIPGVDSGLLARAVRRHGGTVHGPLCLEDIPAAAAVLAADCEAVLVMGAGSIDDAARSMAAAGPGAAGR